VRASSKEPPIELRVNVQLDDGRTCTPGAGRAHQQKLFYDNPDVALRAFG